MGTQKTLDRVNEWKGVVIKRYGTSVGYVESKASTNHNVICAIIRVMES